jgi:hypothetical protein
MIPRLQGVDKDCPKPSSPSRTALIPRSPLHLVSLIKNVRAQRGARHDHLDAVATALPMAGDLARSTAVLFCVNYNHRT